MMDIIEQQGRTRWPSTYKYVGYDAESGLHMFENEGKLELFARHQPGTGDAGWHLRRGSYVFEFCRSK
jgi:hypothetical protein